MWTLVDATGRTVETGTAKGSTDTITLHLGSALPAGVYSLRLNGVEQRTIVVK
ncbi:MAG: T9SS type A sorting domain-containing protein [Ignavibacteria bacterium]|nr:T9SS type A sorting domain-containing protein [Ignavibacteria bacterium]